MRTCYRWQKEYGALKLDQAKRQKKLERENAKLKRVVAELSMENQVLKNVAEGNV
jgi:putative transposase